MAAIGYRRPDIRVLRRIASCTAHFLSLGLVLREDVRVVQVDLMECGVWMDVGAVCVGFVDDLSGYVCEYNEWMIFGKCWNGHYSSGLGEGVWSW